MTDYFNKLTSGDDPLITTEDTFTVTGHSLGGALAQALTAANPDYIDSTMTYNSPGILLPDPDDENQLIPLELIPDDPELFGWTSETYAHWASFQDNLSPENIDTIAGKVYNFSAQEGLTSITDLNEDLGEELRVIGESHSIGEMITNLQNLQDLGIVSQEDIDAYLAEADLVEYYHQSSYLSDLPNWGDFSSAAAYFANYPNIYSKLKEKIPAVFSGDGTDSGGDPGTGDPGTGDPGTGDPNNGGGGNNNNGGGGGGGTGGGGGGGTGGLGGGGLGNIRDGDQRGRGRPTDPLVLDLDNDGFEFTNLDDSNSYFDLEGGSLFKTKTSWLAPDDGFLAWDKNGDGNVNDINELFGNNTLNGFDELALSDTNSDGVINAEDDVFQQLKVWQDLNGDGQTQQGELKDLGDYNITAINLANTPLPVDASQDSNITHEGSYTVNPEPGNPDTAETAKIGNATFTNLPEFTKFGSA